MDTRNRSQESTIFLVYSSYFSSCFKFCVCLSNKSGMFVMKSAFWFEPVKYEMFDKHLHMCFYLNYI